MHNYKLKFRMADGSIIEGDSKGQPRNLEEYTKSLAQSDRHIFIHDNGVAASVVNMRYVVGVEIREVWC